MVDFLFDSMPLLHAYSCRFLRQHRLVVLGVMAAQVHAAVYLHLDPSI